MTRQYEFEDFDEDEWERAEDSAGTDKSPRVARRHLTSASLGFLAMLPMFLIYEAAVQATDGLARNSSELLIFRIFAPLGTGADWARWISLFALAVGAVWVCHKRDVAPVPGAARIGLEGVLGALFIGPVIAWSLGLFGEGLSSLELHARMQAHVPSAPPDLTQAALVFGGAAYEELLFRVFLFSSCFLLSRRVADFFGAPQKYGRVVSEILAGLVSSLLFAAFHLAVFLPAAWGGGEAYDSGVFAWRVLAGLFLCVLFRWRGPGVAAWTHGLFNLALLVGAVREVRL